jgi:sirohydrochlorin cobaltochelatase
MAGEEEDSWVNVLRKAGYNVSVRLEGLGLNEAWADIYVERLRVLEKDYLEKK